MADLSISLLGPFAATLDGEPLDRFRSNKVQALLIYLTVEASLAKATGDGKIPIHRRDALMSLLWPDMPQTSAQSNLRQTLFRLRKSIPDVTLNVAQNVTQSSHGTEDVPSAPLVVTDRQTVQLNPDITYKLDVATFYQLLHQPMAHDHPQENGVSGLTCQQQWQQAAKLYRGDFLSDFYLADSAEFETWAETQREALRRLMLDALDKLTTSYIDEGAYAQAQATARQQLAIDNLRESAHRQLMRALVDDGQRTAALTQYDLCYELLDNELGVAPSAETSDLYAAIRAGEFEQPYETRRDTATEVEIRRPISSAALPTSRPMEQAQRILLTKVESFWIKGVLEQSLHNAVFIELGKEVQPDAVSYPWNLVLQRPDQPRQMLPTNQPIEELFDSCGQALLILGTPGAGKTTTLLTLCRAKIAQAQADSGQPIPVVFNLSSWSKRQHTLSDWLVNELNEKYLIPKKLGREWVEAGRLIYLLDGLDEARDADRLTALEAINDFRQEHGLAQMAICSRTAEYAELSTELRLETAIELQPLTTEQVQNYVTTVGPQLRTLQSALQQDETLQRFARSPLMLSILFLAYQGLPPTALPHSNSEESQRQHIFATYIRQMFKRRGDQQLYPVPTMTRWLTQLAQGMTRHDETLLLIDRLQPSWLMARSQRWLFALATRMLIGLVGGASFVIGFAPIAIGIDDATVWLASCVGGISTGAAVAIISQLRRERITIAEASGTLYEPRRTEAFFLVLGFGLIAGCLFVGTFTYLGPGLAYGQDGALGNAIVYGLLFGLREYGKTAATEIRAVEALSWSWPAAGRGFLLGTALGGGFGLVDWIAEVAQRGYFLPGYFLIFTLLIGILFGLLRALSGKTVSDKAQPNQGILLSARNMFVAGGVVTILMWLLLDLGLWLAIGRPEGGIPLNLFSLRVGIGFGLIMSLWYGGMDLIYHSVLRLMLWLHGILPLNLAQFLNHATSLIFLRKVGGGYIFVHHYLQDYFATAPRENMHE
ncbi:MAG: BTAD domain-containing putative transcriptional regulator [Chloroflexota bacterium]